MKIKFTPWCFLLVACCFLSGRLVEVTKIDLKNPSFEGEPRAGEPPDDWTDMGFPGETPPDVQPGFFECTMKAHDGSTYLAMVVRDNETNEAVGQMFSNGFTMQKGKTYSFSLSLAQSKNYVSISRLTSQKRNFDKPVKLAIWSLTKNSLYEGVELLAESPLINHSDWRTYAFTMTPEKDDCYGIILEVYWASKPDRSTSGHILVDNCSSIILEE